MELEVSAKQNSCYQMWINETSSLYTEGSLSQYVNHSERMYAPLNRINLNLTGSSQVLQQGSTACRIPLFGVIDKDVVKEYGHYANGSIANVTLWRAIDYESSNANWKDLQSYLDTRCLAISDCKAWTWIEGVNGSNNSFV